MEKKRYIGLIGVFGATSLLLTACGSGGGQSSSAADSLKVVYQKTDSFTQLNAMLEKATSEFESTNVGVTVSLEPIAAQESEYFTKLALMNGSVSTAPDVIFEDTYQVRSDAAAGYLLPMDDCLAGWDEWEQFEDAAKQAGIGDDGKIYGVSMGTDTRGIFYNKKIFKDAGLPTDWQPESWDDLLEAARTIQSKVPDVIPINIYSSTSQGEAASMQGFEMLLYGTGDTLYDAGTQQWVVGSQGMVDSLTFLKTLRDEELSPNLEDALDVNLANRVSGELLPEGKLAIAVDGSWLPGGWINSGNKWDKWADVIGMAAMPTQNGQEPGSVSMSGGWLLSIGANTKNSEAACEFIKTALNQENSLKYDTENSQIAVRSDVAEDPEYLSYNSAFEFFSSLVAVTNFRPATPDYPQISDNLQIASESVITGQATPEQAAETYDQQITSVVGEDQVVESK